MLWCNTGHNWNGLGGIACTILGKQKVSGRHQRFNLEEIWGIIDMLFLIQIDVGLWMPVGCFTQRD